ncbi:phosphoglycerol transferase MdoB-like AlkP superfamily enzyme [Bacillus mesophilus]|uniref:LTA synthase family protein n=1 Tax=Bacillus mesophilus TaxID=1808955 RepID=A0A6M0Q5J4_9BACI|nr:LTA synthase family protein [Bacillus mesophilus]MBM7660849.1 phosphoglycerol transferase MdoB-like AlkP superfamily enzyme [Bacillus mesophilus]NEY71605.1 LTA synthase family protein [Bacillus mesophilus]
MNIKSTFVKMWPLYLTIIMLWIKTYVVYKTSFDIKIESLMQELILFINPLSFLLFFFGITLLVKEKARIPLLYTFGFITSFVLFANVVYYRFFNDFLTIPVLFQTSNMADLGNSASELMHFSDLLIFSDLVILWIVLTIAKKKQLLVNFQPLLKREKASYVLMATIISVVNLGLAEIERPQLLTRTFDREMLVKNIGTYNFHIYDVLLQSKSSAQRAFADGSEFVEIENYLKANVRQPNEELFGIAKDKNIIVISMESTQSFVIGETIDGELITPFLNEFIKDSYYFDNFYHQTGQGKTSDSEFLLDNSLYPLGRGAVFFTHGTNEYQGTPELIKDHGYYSSVMHANNKSFWNRDIMYQSLGYDHFFEIGDYEVNEENSIGWGLKDKEFFEQSIELLKSQPEPYYTKFITLTNHFPFELNEEDKLVNEYTSNSRTLNRYFPTVRYTDEAIKHFIQRLKDEGIYENSIIILYGDHYGISENHNKAMAQFLGKDEITPFDSVQLQKVPLIVHIPGHKVKENVISKVSGQIDLKPTILNLMGISSQDQVQFGTDLFSENKIPFTVLRDGSFITDEYVYTNHECYKKSTGEPTEAAECEPFMDKAKKELEYSDKIVYGDLLRFYDGNDYLGEEVLQQDN